MEMTRTMTMKNFNTEAFVGSLSEETLRMLTECGTAEEVMALIEAEGIDLAAFAEDDEELSFDELDNVTGGKGFLPSAVAAIMMLTSSVPLISSADSTRCGSDLIPTFTRGFTEFDEHDNVDIEPKYNGHRLFDAAYNTNDGKFSFKYSDGVFEDDPIQYSTHLATIAASLAHASSTYKDGEGSYKDGARFIREALQNIGFENIFESDSYHEKPTEDSIGCIIGSKTVHTEDGDKKVISITIRSGGYEKEWASNVKLGVSGEAEGFSKAADQVVGEAGKVLDFTSDDNSFLRQYFDKYGEELGLKDDLDNGDIIFMVQGWSRGGAVSNLSAKRLIDAAQPAGNAVSAYCIEAPQGGIASEERSDRDYRSIHNVINEDDFVPFVAPTNMGFKRYGVDHYLQRGEGDSYNIIKAGSITKQISPFENNDSDNLDSVIDTNKQSKRVKCQLINMLGRDDSRTGKSSFNKIQLYRWKLTDPTSFKKDTGSRTSTGLFLNKFINELVVSDEHSDEGVSRSEYAFTMQSGIAELLSWTMSLEDNDRNALMDSLGKAISPAKLFISALIRSNVLRDVGYYDTDYVIADLDEKNRSVVTQVVQNQLRDNEKVMELLDKFPSGGERVLETLGSVCVNLLGSKIDVNKIVTFIQNAGSIFNNHDIIPTAAWLRSFDDWYDDCYTDEFKAESAEMLEKDIPVLIEINELGKHGFKSASLKIYGKMIEGIDDDGDQIISEEVLLEEREFTANGNTKTVIPKEVLPESIRIVIDYDDGTDRTLNDNGETTGAELIGKVRRDAPEVSYKNISDLEIWIGYSFLKKDLGASVWLGFENTSYGSLAGMASFRKD